MHLTSPHFRTSAPARLKAPQPVRSHVVSACGAVRSHTHSQQGAAPRVTRYSLLVTVGSIAASGSNQPPHRPRPVVCSSPVPPAASSTGQHSRVEEASQPAGQPVSEVRSMRQTDQRPIRVRITSARRAAWKTPFTHVLRPVRESLGILRLVSLPELHLSTEVLRTSVRI
jgi:hypothetical protein